MRTAEEYFAALEECLHQMSAEDRRETITYYREYAQEGGLLDAEQLREHFGPPEILAAHILEDNAGKEHPIDPKKDVAAQNGRLILVLLGIVSLIAGLFVIFQTKTSDISPSRPVSVTQKSDSTSSSTSVATLQDQERVEELPLHYDGEVDPFTEIAVDVVSAKIKLEIGDSYALRYDLSDQEIVDRAGVEGQTLYLTSHNKQSQPSNPWSGEVCITVPEGTDFGSLRFSTVNGGVTIPEVSCDSIYVDNVAGDSVINCTVENDVTVNTTSGSVRFGGQCRRMALNATSGSLTFSGKADTVLLETTMGTLAFSGTASSVEMDATSGNAQIEGIVTEQVQIDMVSGNILVIADDPNVTAEGKMIDYNGQRVAEDSWSHQGSGCILRLKTTSGSISIRNL